jgi:acid stress-induced BolA-like protein IbaG/YrbA
MAKVDTARAVDFRARVKDVFNAAYPEGYVDVSTGYRTNVHVVIVSRAFDDMKEEEKQEAVWAVARRHLGKDAQRISIMLAYSPDELKG